MSQNFALKKFGGIPLLLQIQLQSFCILTIWIYGKQNQQRLERVVYIYIEGVTKTGRLKIIHKTIFSLHKALQFNLILFTEI